MAGLNKDVLSLELPRTNSGMAKHKKKTTASAYPLTTTKTLSSLHNTQHPKNSNTIWNSECINKMHGNLKALRYWVSLLFAHTLTVTAHHQLTFSKQHIAMTWLHRSMPCPTSCQVWQLESWKIPIQDRKISEDVPKKSTLDPYTGWKIRKWSPPYTNTFCWFYVCFDCFSCLIRDPCCMELGQSQCLTLGLSMLEFHFQRSELARMPLDLTAKSLKTHAS